ncbi:hypothetical protein MNBD_ALPHA07-125 [hydrothermal vent metagenome]|uniref:DUF1097 domain-containing protein n=1 Tax=hydrothermal vent metagenome TaxID=652676 RepID=A0A3B0SPT0_9ZZZZ
MRKIDFYTAAAPMAFIVGFGWVYLSIVFLNVPGWPAMVAMAGYYAVGGLACHERHDNAAKSIKGLLLGVVVSWIGVAIWAAAFKGNPVAMGVVMGGVAMTAVMMTKLRLMGDFQFIALPQAFLGATIYFGLFNTFMMAGMVPGGMLFGSLQAFVLEGKVQPHVAGVLAIVSVICGVLLGYIHQWASLRLSGGSDKSEQPSN